MIRISRAKHPRRRKVFSQCKTSAASEGVLAGGSLAGVMRMGASYGKGDVRQCIYLYIRADFGRCTAAQVLTGKWEQADLLPEDGPPCPV